MRSRNGGSPARKSRLDLVFLTERGTSETHQNIVQRHWHKLQLARGVVVPVLDKAGKPVVDKKGKPALAPKYSGLHNLRHFFASLVHRPAGSWRSGARP